MARLGMRHWSKSVHTTSNNKGKCCLEECASFQRKQEAWKVRAVAVSKPESSVACRALTHLYRRDRAVLSGGSKTAPPAPPRCP